MKVHEERAIRPFDTVGEISRFKIGSQHLGTALVVPGIVTKEGEHGPYLTLRGPAGIVIPCRDSIGRIVALKIRRGNDGKGPKYVYCSSKGHGGAGHGAPIHVPLGTPTESEVIRLTEGELKADVLWARNRTPTISLPGVNSWRSALAVVRAMGCKTVRIAFDADAWINPIVARSLGDCAKALTDAGVVVEIERVSVTPFPNAS